MQKDVYKDGTSNHEEHNSNPWYWSMLLRPLIVDPTRFNHSAALDFGCGKGRNCVNIGQIINFDRIDGVDLSQANIDHCKKNYPMFGWYTNNGVDLQNLSDDTYDFVLSTITLQHIPVHEIRFNLIKEIFRVMKNDAVFSFQMGFDEDFDDNNRPSTANIGFLDNFYDAAGTNSDCDVRIEQTDLDLLKNDLELIGFKHISMAISPSWSDHVHPRWLYVIAVK